MARSITPRRGAHARAVRPSPPADDLGRLLANAARGDTGAFMRFYDLTSATAYRAALAVCADRACAEELTGSLYARAWAEASAYPRSGLSPLAWLLATIMRTDADLPARGSCDAAETWLRGA